MPEMLTRRDVVSVGVRNIFFLFLPQRPPMLQSFLPLFMNTETNQTRNYRNEIELQCLKPSHSTIKKKRK